MKLDKIINKINYIIIYLLFIMLPLTIFIKFYSTYFSALKFINVFFYDILWIIIPIEIVIYCYNLKKKKFKLSIFDFLLYALIILAMLSTNFAIDLTTSIWGAYLRNEGFLSIFSYYLLFLNCKSMITRDQIKKIINIFIIIGIVQFIFSILQVFVRGPFEAEILNGIKYMASGLNGNPNFLGSYLVLLISITTAMYLLEENSNYYLFVSILFFSNLILAASTGPFFAVVFVFVFLMILLGIKKKILWKKIGILFGSLIITFFATDALSERIFVDVYNDKLFNGYTIKGDILNTLNIFNKNMLSSEKQELIENYGSGRIIIWKNSLKIVKKNIWLGVGLDNFGYAYTNIVKPIGHTCDKAHNVYLQILATNGVFAFIIYLTLLGIIFFKGIKTKDNLTLVLFMGFVGYSVQAFLNISVVTVAPFYFIIMGLLVNLLNSKENYK